MMVNTMKLVISSVAVAFGLLGAQAASAGGYTPAVVEPQVDAVVVTTPVTVGDWQGAYGGVTLGYGFNGDDRFGLKQDGENLGNNLGKLEVKGANAGLRVGYRWQRNKWVVGPELSFEGGNVKDDFDLVTDGTTANVESKLRNKVALAVKAGYEVNPNTLVFGTAGVTRGSFDYSLGSAKEKYNSTGYVLGLGVERKVTERMSVTGEVEHNGFKSEDVEFNNSGVTTEATPEFTNVKLGLNFKF